MESVCLTTSYSLITTLRKNHNNTTRNLNLYSAARLIRCYSTKSRRSRYWDSNAEAAKWTDRFKIKFEDELNDDGDEFEDDEYFGKREKKRRNWWSDEDDNDSPEMERGGGGGGGIWEEAVDNIWIIKVFSAFGWLLPAVVASLLLASGPKAFLMALALPLGQSILSYAIDKLFGRINNNPKSRSRTKRKPFARRSRDATMSEEKDEEEISQTSGERSGYQSWVGADMNAPAEKKDNQGKTTFGGWDELDLRGRTSGDGATKRPPRKRGGLPREMKGKLTKKGRNNSTPLLIRLLIAVFPFLGSWTRIL